jgi:hypothetical protein
MTREPELGPLRSRALHLANKAGYDADMIARALLREDEMIEEQRRRGPGAASQRATAIATWACSRVATHPKDEYKARVLTRIVEYRAQADSIPWSGRSGPCDRRVLEAFFMAASYAASTKFRYAARTIGSRAGMPWRTALEATHRLMNRNFIRFEGNYGPELGTKYSIAAPRSWDVRNLQHRSYPPAPIVQVPGMSLRSPADPLVAHLLRHPAFGSHALGDPGWLLAHWLDVEDPMRSCDLALCTGMSYKRVNTTLSSMKFAQIARKTEDGWIRIPDADLGPMLDRHLIRLVGGPHLLLVQDEHIEEPGAEVLRAA